MIIDDDVLVRQALGDCMESAGYAVESFGSAEQFLASGGTGNAACLILDVQLPGVTGLELQDEPAGAVHRVPIVFVSAQETEANRQRAMSHGAAGFLSKPFRRDDLVKLVNAATSVRPVHSKPKPRPLMLAGRARRLPWA